MAEYRKKAGVRKLRSINALVSELEIPEVKGALYSLFHHTCIDSFSKMATSGSVWLSRIDQMNDGTEVFKDADRTYAFCLSAKPSENVAMWIVYGLPRREAIRVRFPGKALMDVVKANDGYVSVYPVNGNKVQSKPVTGRASLHYVGYVSRGGERVHVGNVIYKLPAEKNMSRVDVMDRCGSYIKRLGWAYEHEIRLVIHLDKKVDAKKIQLDIPEVFRKILTYKPQRRNGSDGMPSVIVGPWGNCEMFVEKFRNEIKKLTCMWPDDIRYFLDHATSDGRGIVRESEYMSNIKLGRCDGCKIKASCVCAYNETQRESVCLDICDKHS